MTIPTSSGKSTWPINQSDQVTIANRNRPMTDAIYTEPSNTIVSETTEIAIPGVRVLKVKKGQNDFTNEERQVCELAVEFEPLPPTMSFNQSLVDLYNAAKWRELANGGPPQTDRERAEFLGVIFGGYVRYCRENKSWMSYTGGRWTDDSTLAEKYSRQLPEVLAHIAFNEGKNHQVDWLEAASKASSIYTIRSALAWAETCHSVSINDFDANPWLLNLQNGTLDLKTGVFRDHDANDKITKISPVKYDPDAKCPKFLETLAMFQPDPDVQELILQFGGYSLTGVITDLCVPIWYGPLANNGKSTITEALRSVLGPDYSMTLDVEFLMENKPKSSDEYYMAQLRGMRHVLFEEPGETASIRSKTLKMLADNRSELVARHPHGRPFRFRPEFKCHLVTNHKPTVKATDNGTWRRLLLIPFGVTIDPAKDDTNFKQRLFAESSGILNVLIGACQRWQAAGKLAVPDTIRQANQEFRSASDATTLFITECCVTGSVDYRAGAGDLYAAYRDYMMENPDLGEPQSAHMFGRRMGELFKKDGSKRYHGIGIRDRSF